MPFDLTSQNIQVKKQQKIFYQIVQKFRELIA